MTPKFEPNRRHSPCRPALSFQPPAVSQLAASSACTASAPAFWLTMDSGLPPQVRSAVVFVFRSFYRMRIDVETPNKDEDDRDEGEPVTESA